MSYQLKLGDSKRERKLTDPNTLPAVHGTKGPSKSRGASRCGPALPRPRQEAGGGERGGLARGGTPTAPQAGLQLLTEDLLRLWTVGIRREGRRETQGPGTLPAQAGMGLGTRRGEGARTRLARAGTEAGTD